MIIDQGGALANYLIIIPRRERKWPSNCVIAEPPCVCNQKSWHENTISRVILFQYLSEISQTKRPPQNCVIGQPPCMYVQLEILVEQDTLLR